MPLPVAAMAAKYPSSSGVAMLCLGLSAIVLQLTCCLCCMSLVPNKLIPNSIKKHTKKYEGGEALTFLSNSMSCLCGFGIVSMIVACLMDSGILS